MIVLNQSNKEKTLYLAGEKKPEIKPVKKPITIIPSPQTNPVIPSLPEIIPEIEKSEPAPVLPEIKPVIKPEIDKP